MAPRHLLAVLNMIAIFTQFNVFTAISMALAFVPLLIMVYSILRGMEDSNLCMDCQQCVAVCPVMQSKDTYFGPRGIMIAARSGNMAKANKGEVFSCTSCMACVKACPRGLNVKHVMDHTRAALAEKGEGQMPAHKHIVNMATTHGNVFEDKPKIKPGIEAQKEGVTNFFRNYSKIAGVDIGLKPPEPKPEEKEEEEKKEDNTKPQGEKEGVKAK